MGLTPDSGYRTEISNEEFEALSQLALAKCGIVLDNSRKHMLVARLSRRLRTLGLNSFEDYYRYLFTPKGASTEMPLMIDAVTTHTTEFFREDKHFPILTDVVLPSLESARRKISPGPIAFWSAGCSTGEEPYTLCMVLDEYFGSPDRFTIYATDISVQAVEFAETGIYTQASIEHIPERYRSKYLLKGKGDYVNQFRIVPELRNRVTFKTANLLDDWIDLPKVDVVFCRNVIIYFCEQTKKRAIQSMHNQLNGDGYLFVGHSETLYGLTTQFAAIAPTVYKRK